MRKGCGGCLGLILLSLAFCVIRWFTLPPVGSYLDPVMARVTHSWDLKELQPEIDPDVLTAVPPSKWAEMLDVFSDGLGPSSRIDPFSTRQVKVNLDGSAYAACYAKGHFAKADAELTVSCVYHGGRWWIQGIHLNSDAFKPTPRTPRPKKTP